MSNKTTASNRPARRGLLLVLSSPSGAGKTTLSRRLLELEPNLVMSVSATTRPKRPSEENGVDYWFVDDAEFDRMRAAGEFLESATVFGHCYGTPRQTVAETLAVGRDVLFDVDWQGTQQLSEYAHDDLVSIFILPPSAKELERRLRQRAQDSVEVVRNRMAKANNEITHYQEYAYIIINEDVEESLASARAILTAERLNRVRQTGLSDFVRTLSEGLAPFRQPERLAERTKRGNR